MPEQPDDPKPDDDHLDWNVNVHGRMRDYATRPKDEPVTEPWEG